MDAVEVLIEPGMRRTIEVRMAPAATKGKIAAMTSYRIADFFPTSCWVEP